VFNNWEKASKLACPKYFELMLNCIEVCHFSSKWLSHQQRTYNTRINNSCKLPKGAMWYPVWKVFGTCPLRILSPRLIDSRYRSRLGRISRHVPLQLLHIKYIYNLYMTGLYMTRLICSALLYNRNYIMVRKHGVNGNYFLTATVSPYNLYIFVFTDTGKSRQ
jgi:hypothetical protein